MKKTFTLITALVIAVASLSGCNSGDDKKNGSIPTVSIISPDNGRVNKADNEVIEEVGKKLGIKVDLNLVMAAEFQNKLNVMVASDTMPDIIRTINYDFFEYIQQNALYDMTDLIEKNGTNMKNYIPEEVWDRVRYDGKIYTIPNYNWAGKSVNVMRKDWLDKVGVGVPTNLDELRDAYLKMTYNDPDGNGKNDTFAHTTAGEITFVAFPDTFQHIFGAYGIQPGMYFEKDGTAIPASVTPEYKEALVYLNKLYQEDKVMDPDIFIVKTDQARQSLAQGRFGSVTGWWSLIPGVLIDQMKMKEKNPAVEWVKVPPITGPNGKKGLRSAGDVNGSASMSAKTKNPEAAFSLLDFVLGDEGAYLVAYGIEGKHHTKMPDHVEMTPEGKKGSEDKWLDSLGMLLQRVDITMNNNKVSSPENWEYIEFARDTEIYSDLFEGVSTVEAQKYITDVKKVELEWLAKFVTGREPVSNFDAYIADWKAKGGQQMLDSLTKEYNTRAGTNLKSFTVQ